MAQKIATVANYGNHPSAVQFVVVTVHRGEQVIKMKVFRCEQYESIEDLTRDVMAFVKKYKARAIHQVRDVLPPEEAYCCGEIVPRLSFYPAA